jgi:hypothetical protein
VNHGRRRRRAREASQEEEDGRSKTAREPQQALLGEILKDVHGLPLRAVPALRVLLLPLMGRKKEKGGPRTGVTSRARRRRDAIESYPAQEEHAKAKKGRERRKAEAEAKAEEKDAEARPDLAKPISSLTTA